MKKTITNRQAFFDLFVLCLSWQWKPLSIQQTWTTFDKVSRILCGLGIITERQKRTLWKNKPLQVLFRAYTMRLPAHTFQLDRVLAAPSILVLQLDPAREIHGGRLLRDFRLHLTKRGKKYAELVEKDCAHLITKEAYLAEIARQAEKTRAMGEAAKRYKERVETELAAEA